MILGVFIEGRHCRAVNYIVMLKAGICIIGRDVITQPLAGPDIVKTWVFCHAGVNLILGCKYTATNSGTLIIQIQDVLPQPFAVADRINILIRFTGGGQIFYIVHIVPVVDIKIWVNPAAGAHFVNICGLVGNAQIADFIFC